MYDEARHDPAMAGVMQADWASMDSPPGAVTRRSPRQVLIVDDNDDGRDVLCDLLGSYGFQVASARNGVEALAYLSDRRPALILLDLMMPEMNGWELLARLEGDPRLAAIPVAVISASHDRPARARYFLRRPYDIDRMLEMVREHCGEEM